MNSEADDAATVSEIKPNRKPLLWAGIVLAAVVASIGIWNGTVYFPVSNALSGESGSSTIAYRRWLVSPDEIVFDIRSVDPSASMAEMDRRLFKAAEALKDRSYSKVVLTYRGTGKFLLEGGQFKTIGEEREFQNPIYTIRTLQEHVANMDGSPAFETWTGGWLGVMGQQMNDHNEMHARWWVRDASKQPEGTPIGETGSTL